MTKESRDKIIEINDQYFNSVEIRHVYAISSLIGDDQEIDIDWDDINEVTGLNNEDIEEILNAMYDLDILEILSYEDSIYG